MRADSPLYASRRRSRRRSLSIPAALALAAGAAALLAILVGLAFAGSQSELAPGTRVAGVDVGGLTKREAVAKLDSLFEQRSPHPVAFMAATSSYRFAANQLAVQPDWNAAVAAAGRAGDGFGPVRGFRRLRARVFGAEVLPRLVVSNAALEYVLDKISADVDQQPRSARLVRHGLRIQVVPDQPGSRLDRDCRGRHDRSHTRTARTTVRGSCPLGRDDDPARDGGACWRLRRSVRGWRYRVPWS